MVIFSQSQQPTVLASHIELNPMQTLNITQESLNIWKTDGGRGNALLEIERMARMDIDPKSTAKLSMAQQIAKVASEFQQQRTGVTPGAVSVTLNDNTLVITLHDSLSVAEKILASNPEGAAQVQEYHKQLFATSAEQLCKEIKRITGVEVLESVAQVVPDHGTTIQVFKSGTMVKIFMLASSIPAATWNGGTIE